LAAISASTVWIRVELFKGASMLVTERTPVGDVVAKHPRAAGVFEKYQIDYCCRGDQPLGVACHAAGLPPSEVIGEILRTSLESSQDRDWTTATLSELAVHIVSTHHAFLRNELPALEARLRKVILAHGERHGDTLDPLSRAFLALKQELDTHLEKEELALFPVIERFERAHVAQEKRPPTPFGSIRNPIGMMEHEHRSAGDLLSRMRQATLDYTVPPDGCATYRALFEGLVRLEADLHRHIHLENNILFPRAIGLEAAFD
jgi:regulator of cell morphogenesis and NO signaling